MTGERGEPCGRGTTAPLISRKSGGPCPTGCGDVLVMAEAAKITLASSG